MTVAASTQFTNYIIFSNLWNVKSSALSEDFATEAKWDVEKITEENNENLVFKKEKISKNTHYTVVTLKDLNHKVSGRATESVKNHLASMYRSYIDKNGLNIHKEEDLILVFDHYNKLISM